MTLPTPDDSTASWLDADDSYQVGDFLDEATRILHDEGDFSDAYHERLRFEYDQWKRIPHLRIIGKRIDCSCEKAADEHHLTTNDHVIGRQTTAVENDDWDLLRNRVIKIMTEILWQRVLDKTSVKSVRRKQLTSCRLQSSDRIESVLIVSPMLPANKPRPIVIKSRPHNIMLETVNQNAKSVYRGPSTTKYNKKLWSKNSVNILPPIKTHQKKVADKTKRWFSAIGTPGRNHTLPRPVTSVTTQVNAGRVNVCFDISVDGKSCIKSSKKKGCCSPTT